MPTKAINRLLAGCAFEAFIAKENNNGFSGLRNRIGKYANVFKESEIRKMLRDQAKGKKLT